MVNTKVLRIILAISVVFISLFGLLTDNNWVFPYMFLLLGVLMLVSGIEEIRSEKKYWGYADIGISVLLFVYFIQIYFFS